MSGLAVWAGVAALGAVGALARFAAASYLTARTRSSFPVGTFTVNVTGAFALGVLTGLGLSHDALMLAGTGFLGSYTTFSTWMVEAERLGEAAERGRMWLYLLGSMAAGLAAAGAGWALGAAF